MESLADTALAERLTGPGSLSLKVRGIRLRVAHAGPTPEASASAVATPANRTPPTGRLPLLLLHGFGASVFSWRLVLGALAADRPVVAYDRPGFGLSERPRRGDWCPAEWPRGTPYSPESQADIAVALLDRLELGQAVLVGHSAGGAIASLAAIRHPERVAALVLVDAAMTGPPRWALSAAGLPVVRSLVRGGSRIVVGQMSRFFRQAWFDPTTMPPETVAGYTAPAELPGWEDALMETMAAGPLPEIVPELATLPLPTLVVSGQHDHVVPLAQSRALASALPRSTLVVLPWCGHLPPEEQPERFARAVRRFVNGLSHSAATSG